MPPTVRWILSEAEKLLPNSEYFFSEQGQIHGKTYQILKRVCSELNIPYGKYTADGYVINDLRHTITTTLQQNRIDAASVQTITGHRRVEMVGHYTHASNESRKAAVEVIERKLSLNQKYSGKSEKDFPLDVIKDLFEKIKSGEVLPEEFARLLSRQD